MPSGPHEPDVGELYCLFSRRLDRIVRALVIAPDTVIEDACQFAWSRLVHHRGAVRREMTLTWLITTARREAVRLDRHARRDLSLDAVMEAGAELPPSAANRSPHAVAETRERLKSLAGLPARQQRLLWMYGVGLRYEEIARREGCSPRAVERQIQRARAKLRRERVATAEAALL